MKSSTLSTYHRLPYRLRCAMATVRGAQIQRNRYGPRTRAMIAEAHAREAWSAAQWSAWQSELLTRQLRRAAISSPFYRERYGELTALASPELLSEWPVIHKEDLREHEHLFISERRPSRHLIEDHTSGTTGTPLTLTFSREAVRAYYALFQARTLQWNGVGSGQSWAMLGGQLVTATDQRVPPFWVWNAAARQLYLSSFHISDQSAVHYAEAMRRYGVNYVLGYPSAMAALARGIEASKKSAPPLTVAISNAEPLFPDQREVIARVFQCPVRDSYGMSEAVAGAAECEHGSLHLWPEAGVLEVLDDEGGAASPGEVGRIVCTGLLNDAMPLVRYDVGDRGSLAPEGPCACGRALPRLQEIVGRTDDVVITSDGRLIGRLDGVFKADIPIREAQIIQKSLTNFVIKIVPGEGFASGASEAVLIERLRERVGAVVVRVEYVDGIPRTANGKFRAVISEVERYG